MLFSCSGLVKNQRTLKKPVRLLVYRRHKQQSMYIFVYFFTGEAPVYIVFVFICIINILFLHVTIEADNDTLCSSGSRSTDATVSVCCKRMSVGETCVKRGDISCC